MSPRLVVDNTVPPVPAFDTFAFAIGAGTVFASRNGAELKAGEALLQLVKAITELAIANELATAKALSEPRSML